MYRNAFQIVDTCSTALLEVYNSSTAAVLVMQTAWVYGDELSRTYVPQTNPA